MTPRLVLLRPRNRATDALTAIVAVVLAASAGCALRVQSPSGNTWVVGCSRPFLEVTSLRDGNHVVVHESNRGPLLALGIIPYGLESYLGLHEEMLGSIVPREATNRWEPVGGLALKLGGRGPAPWRFGVVHYRVPRNRTDVQVQMTTTKGAAVRLTSVDPSLRMGCSQTCVTTVNSDSISVNVNANFGVGAPTLQLSNEPTQNE